MSVVAEGTPVGDAGAPVPPATPRLILRSSEFRKGREAGWRELEGFIKEVERRSLLALSV